VEAVEKAFNEKENDTLSVLDNVASLLDKSLLIQSAKEGEEPRLQMLLTVREYGLELLRESGEVEKSQRAHALYYLTLVEEAEAHLKGREQTTWLARLELEQENLRAALAWLVEQGEAELALRFCGALWWFWHLRGYWSEGRRWLEAALGMAQTGGPTVARAKALCAAGDLAYYQDDYAAARPLLEESVELCRTLELKRELASALGALGVLLHVQGDLAAARPLLEESEALCRTLKNNWELSYLLRKLGQRVLREGNMIQAAVYARESLTLARELGDKSLIATALLTMANIAGVQAILRRQQHELRKASRLHANSATNLLSPLHYKTWVTSPRFRTTCHGRLHVLRKASRLHANSVTKFPSTLRSTIWDTSPRVRAT
jgi:tetratricopeptide (TPR) repeat protein